MTQPEETPDVEQRLAASLDPERHRAPSEGVPQDLTGDLTGDESGDESGDGDPP